MACVLAGSSTVWAVAFGQVDNFENGTTQGWSEGAASPNPPTNVATGGPAGVNDNFLRNLSDGISSGGKMVMFNTSQWAGNYVAAGVTRIVADMVNPGNTSLSMRIALLGPNDTAFSSKTAVDLPAGSDWRQVTFDLDAASLTRVQGSRPLADVLADVRWIRILSNKSAPSLQGENIVGSLGVDNIRAVPEPTGALLLVAGAMAALRPRKRAAAGNSRAP